MEETGWSKDDPIFITDLYKFRGFVDVTQDTDERNVTKKQMNYFWNILNNTVLLLESAGVAAERLRTVCILTQRWGENQTRMWANAQRDGRPAEYRWRPLFNAAKFGWRRLLECRAVTLPRRQTRWNLQGCPKLTKRSQPLVGRSSPYCKDIWRRYCCLTSFFPIVDTCLSCEDMARQSCAMVPRWRFFASCICSEPRAVHFRPAF